MEGLIEDIKSADYILQQQVVLEEKFGRKLTKNTFFFLKITQRSPFLKKSEPKL